MAWALAAGFTFCVRLSKAFRIVANRTVIAHIVVERLLDNVATAVMKAASYFVRTVPHHLGVVADHGRNVISCVSKREVVMFQKPYLDGEKPWHFHIRHEDILSTGSIIFNPASRAVVMDKKLATLRPPLCIPSSSFVPRHFEHVAGWWINSGAKKIVVQDDSFHHWSVPCIQAMFWQHVSVHLRPWQCRDISSATTS